VTASVNNCCGDPSNCWEPCGILGKSAEHVRRSSYHAFFSGESRPKTELILPALPASGPCCADRFRCWPPYKRHPENCARRRERLTVDNATGPHNDLLCIAVGVGLALIFLVAYAFAMVVSP
jgi:hypothetical protein